MASIRKRGSSYLLVVSMGYDYEGNRIRPKQKTVHPPEGLTPKQREKWLKEQAVLFERECRSLPQEEVDRSITLAKYTELWLREIAPGKLAKSTLARDRQDIDRFLPILGHYKLAELRPEHFRNFYAELRKVISLETGSIKLCFWRADKLLIIAFGRPVAMKILIPLALASVMAERADEGISCVLKLTNVPSISKNRAFIIRLFFNGAQMY